jgi:hypothetical protein
MFALIVALLAKIIAKANIQDSLKWEKKEHASMIAS